ncbi:uncharacterized protein LOC116413373 [Galleria mellonella]|uniref:Uncharacterized protein LOC116413373 n=1 Tax=Galleria mellonella TaxID=7137 RepID=A0ABM3MY82_GALME|nr:uncharacterized protein LOC116413373 [Galleria mellonella]
MAHELKKAVAFKKQLPQDFDKKTINTISCLEGNHNVVGLMYFRNKWVELSTLPRTMALVLSKKLPHLNTATMQALNEITAKVNTVNPIVDRIMEDESVEGVIMTNKDGAPVLTNISLRRATNFGLALKRFGTLTQNYIKELDPFDEVLVIRINTKKIEMLVAPHTEFNITIVQHARHKIKRIKDSK